MTIGTELLLGFTIDTNAAELGAALSSVGVRVVRRTTISDRADEIRDAVSQALARTGAVLTTGGLGPTSDDITKNIVAQLFGAELEYDPAIWDGLRERFRKLGREPAERNRSQAEVPHGATVLANRWGTAPGLWLEGTPGLAILLPGVPAEMRGLLRHEVVPRLAARGAGQPIISATLRTTGIAESSLADRVAELEPDLAPLSLAYLPGADGVDLRVTAWGLPPEEASRRLSEALALLRERAGDHAYGTDGEDLAAVILQAAREGGIRLAVAESCTGGLVGGRLTAVPGSSDTFLGGVIAYDNSVKRDLLGVPDQLLSRYGAVSGPVARAMAEGACVRTRAEAAVSVTGIAGPAGGSEEKPVGTVWLATAVRGDVRASERHFLGDRSEIRHRAAQAGLFMLLRHLRYYLSR